MFKRTLYNGFLLSRKLYSLGVLLDLRQCFTCHASAPVIVRTRPNAYIFTRDRKNARNAFKQGAYAGKIEGPRRSARRSTVLWHLLHLPREWKRSTDTERMRRRYALRNRLGPRLVLLGLGLVPLGRNSGEPVVVDDWESTNNWAADPIWCLCIYSYSESHTRPSYVIPIFFAPSLFCF